MRWAKTDSASLGSPHQDTWNLFYQSNPNATGTQVGWVNAGTNFTFGANGSLTSPTGSAISIPGMTVSGQSLGNITVNVGSGGLTQFASTGGTARQGCARRAGRPQDRPVVRQFRCFYGKPVARRRRQPQIQLRRPRPRQRPVRDRATGRSRTGQSRTVLSPDSSRAGRFRARRPQSICFTHRFLPGNSRTALFRGRNPILFVT